MWVLRHVDGAPAASALHGGHSLFPIAIHSFQKIYEASTGCQVLRWGLGTVVNRTNPALVSWNSRTHTQAAVAAQRHLHSQHWVGGQGTLSGAMIFKDE